jgi:hypothetical protein
MTHIANRLIAAGVLLLGACLVGCSSDPPLAPVSGKVTMNGKPLKNVRVDFHPDADKGTRGKGSTGTTNEQGEFTLTYEEGKPGAIVGHHRVILTDLDVFGNVIVGRGDYRTEDPKGPKETPMVPRFGKMYSELASTPFKEEVKPGMGPVKFEVKK